MTVPEPDDNLLSARKIQCEALLGQHGLVIWLTGLSGAGKSTLAHSVNSFLLTSGRLSYILDGDLLRRGLCRDLGFSPIDRHENVRRTAEVASLFADSGIIVLCALISPYNNDRSMARQIVGPNRFIEIFVDTPALICEQRDPKGLWRRARLHEINGFTGIDAPYERPINPDLSINTSNSISDCVKQIADIADIIKMRSLLSG